MQFFLYNYNVIVICCWYNKALDVVFITVVLAH